MNEPVTQVEIDQRVYILYDEYCHGRIDRREFLIRCGAIAGGLVMAQALFPRYAEAQTISFTDTRIKGQYVTYPSPGGNSGTMRGYLVVPAGAGLDAALQQGGGEAGVGSHDRAFPEAFGLEAMRRADSHQRRNAEYRKDRRRNPVHQFHRDAPGELLAQ